LRSTIPLSLFKKYPEYLKTFARLRKVKDPDDLANNRALQVHAVQFMKGMSSLAENIDDLESLDELLYKVASRHQPLGLKPIDMKVIKFPSVMSRVQASKGFLYKPMKYEHREEVLWAKKI
jgi:hemoglobin-like flavoprotein